MNNLKCYNLLFLAAPLFETLRYKSEGRGFNSGFVIGIFFERVSFRPRYSPGVDSVSNRNMYQE